MKHASQEDALGRESLHLAPAAVYPCPIVLYFHHVGRPLPHYTSLSVGRFRALLALLESQFEFLSATHLTEPLPSAASVPHEKPSVILTFDDGYADTLQSVGPLLQDAGVTAGFFVPTAHVGRTLPHPTLGVPLRRASWEELRGFRQAGHLILSHGHRHVPFRTATVALTETTTSRALLAHQLGNTPDCVAYPFGEWPQDAQAIQVGRAFSTVKAPASHWHCRPDRIRRVYLDGSRPEGWADQLSYWVYLWKGSSCAECNNSHVGAEP